MKYHPSAVFALATLAACTVIPLAARAENEVGYIERFALAADREKALGELVPGSEDYYFFHCLHYQSTRNRAKFAEFMGQWRKRYPDEVARRRVIENRQALLDYDATPQQTIEYLKRHLGVTHPHQQEVRDKKPNLPTALDARLVAREAFLQRALAFNHSLGELSQTTMEELVRSQAALSPQQRRALLSKLQRPDVPHLTDVIIADLKTRESRGFGEHAIHRALLPEQLDVLVKAIPILAHQTAFVYTRLRKLAPSPDVDVNFDPEAREAWLERLWAYARTLPPAFNTLKAQILYRRLDHDRGRGIYDPARFIEYLKLPRPFAYVNPRWLEKTAEDRQPQSDLNADLSDALIIHRPVPLDEPLVREYFLALFDQAAKAKPNELGVAMMEPYTRYVLDVWLQPLLAEALITGGHGNPEQWASLLNPVAFQALKDRVDIEFPATNPPWIQPGEAAGFEVIVKNTPKLIVKIYELNALNFFLTQKRQLNTDLNLDGLVANSEQIHTFDTGPFKRTRQTFRFPELKGKRGAWIIEFIGTGRSSRALLRVGQWQVVQQMGPAGDLLTVVDEQAQPVKDAVVWLDGRKYTPDAKSNGIVIPFTRHPGTRQVVVSDPAGMFATLTQFEHHTEDYQFDVQFHVEREQLLARRDATLAIRPTLLLGQVRLDPGLLQEPRLWVTTTTHDGIATTREVKDLKLNAGSVLTHTINVPERLAKLTVTLTGKIEVLSHGGEKRDLTAARTWDVNGIDKTDATHTNFLSKFAGAYTYELLGKNGEAVADQQVIFNFHHRGFAHPETVALKTDERGRIALGALPGIVSIHAKAPNNREDRWNLDEAERTWSTEIHVAAGEVVRVPWMAAGAPGVAAGVELSLLETKAGTFTADFGKAVAIKDGFVEIRDLPPGDYSLRQRSDERDFIIRVTAGKTTRNWVFGKFRNLELKNNAALQITAVTTDDKAVTVKLANAGAFTRVHIAATRFETERGIFSGLGGFMRFGPATAIPAKQPNLFSAGRQIGDEYRYILERRYGKVYPGNMLTRPGLLLNPWEVRDTQQDELSMRGQEQAGMTGGGRGEGGSPGKGAGGPGAVAPNAVAGANIDFLAASAPVLYNLLPDKDGVVRIDRKALGDRQQVQIYAEDLTNAAWQSFALPEVPTAFAEQRLARNLDPQKPFIQRKDITVLTAGKTLTLEDILTSEIELYDTLGSVHALFTTLSGDANLVTFAWILQWPKLSDEEKRAKYSEFACHELNFFLARKDPAFFTKVIQPNLANKKDKTFMDEFLLGKDLSRHLEPTAYGRLNLVERALLAQRAKNEAANAARHLRELWEMVPPNPDLMDRLFETALRGRALESTGDGWRQELKRKREEGRDKADAFANAETAPGEPGLAATPPAASAPRPVTRELLERLRNGMSRDAKQADELAEMPSAEKAALKKELGAEDIALDLAVEEAGARRSALGGAVGKDVEAFWSADEARATRAATRIYYRQLGPTKEWAENNYYKLRIQKQDGSLIPVSGFWRDYAKWIADGGQGAFVSPHVAEASHNFTEMMLALAVLDLPFEAANHNRKIDGGSFVVTAAGAVIAYHKEIKPGAPAAPNAPQAQLLVSQSFFRASDRYRMQGNEKFEKYVTVEFLSGVVYGANVVVTNPTSSPVKADVLMQIPRGALPVLGSKMTDSKSVRLEPYTTKTFEYYFYFPAPGAKKFPHFPVTVAVAEAVAGSAKPFEFNVVAKLTQVDKASWDYISQYGSEEDVWQYLEQNNLAAIPMVRIAWRCHNPAFYQKLTAFLKAHHIWDETIYSYALLHNDADTLREWLLHKNDFIAQCGPWLESELVTIDPVERRAYEHLEYSPLVNQRAHRLGNEPRIANPAVLAQYQALLWILAHKPTLDAPDQMSVTYYLFLQDRVEDALGRFHAVDANALATRLQYDYFKCYAGFYENTLAEVRGIASRYADYPVNRWRLLFNQVSGQLDEIEGKAANLEAGDKPDREKQQAELAATEPGFDLKVENRTITLTYRNLAEATVNYYLMDPEFSFSSNPFVNEDASRFSIIKPNLSVTQPLPKDKDMIEIPLPADFAKANVLVEVVAAGQRKAQAYHANTLKLAVTENYGRLELRDSTNNHAVSKAYVKVYARLGNGTVRFFKDGYTDLRGRFDYASLNSGTINIPVPPPIPLPRPLPVDNAGGLDHQMLKSAELPQIEKFAILILSEANGAATREVAPPRE